jgi:WS/DGAT/MGAT family acyltransferase
MLRKNPGTQRRGHGYTRCMPDSHRLSALDAMFVGIETNELHMHVGAVLVFEAGPLANEEGGIDFERMSKYMETALVHLPNYHRRLKPTPGLRHPVWVDDEHFDINYHLRHTALPKPGSERLLKRLAGRIFSQSLDKKKPLWEIWVVEGLENDRFALICKVHHSMVDGMGGMEVLAGLLRATPDETFKAPTEPWNPEPTPRGLSLLRDELKYRGAGLRSLADRARATWEQVKSGEDGKARAVTAGIINIMKSGLIPAPPSSINPRRVSSHRRFDICRYELAEIKAIKNSLGGKVNDVLLALCAGALRRFLERRGDRVAGLEGFRVLMPVSLRSQGKVNGGNQIALTFIEIPVHIADPERRYQAVLESSARAKGSSHQIEGTALLEELSDVTADALMRESVRAAGALRPYNVIVTNIPGPPFKLYMLGAPLVEMFPLAPLFYQQGLGIALFSYSGEVSIGLGADRQALPDLHLLVEDFDAAYAELREVAGNVAEVAAKA